jgi:hypothetical protein
MWTWRFLQLSCAGWVGSCYAQDFFECTGLWWWWCVGAEGIDGIGWRWRRRHGLPSSRTSFHPGYNLRFLQLVKDCSAKSETIRAARDLSFDSKM